MNRVGEFVNGVEIINYRSAIDIDVRFSDGTIITNVEYSNLKKGSVKNPCEPRIYGIGFIGVGKYDYINNLTAYRTWSGMIKRCYDEKNLKQFPSYIGCSVHSEWHNFQNFAKWFYENYKGGFNLDKDLIEIGNKIYGPNTCCFVPIEINNILTHNKKTRSITSTGVYPYNGKYRASVQEGGKRVYLGVFKTDEEAFNAYKIEKESYIKKQADKYRRELGEIIYNNLINYIVKP